MRSSYFPLLCCILIFACASKKTLVTTDVSSIGTDGYRGTRVSLRELYGGGSFLYKSDQQTLDEIKRVDVNSTLRLSFDSKKDAESVRLSPEWKALTSALESLGDLALSYNELCDRANRLPDAPNPDTEAFQDEVRAFDRDQMAFEAVVLGRTHMPGIMSEDEFDACVLSGQDPYKELAERLNDLRDKLMNRAEASAKDGEQVLVRVRATLKPLSGPDQLLQIPHYHEVDRDELKNIDQKRNAELNRLRAEFEAATAVSNGFREIEVSTQKIKEQFQTMRDNLLGDLMAEKEEIQSIFDNWIGRLEVLIADRSWPREDASIAEKQLALDIEKFLSDLKTARGIVDSLSSLQVLDKPRELSPMDWVNLFYDPKKAPGIQSAFSQIKTFVDGITVGSNSWSAIFERTPPNIVAVLEEEVTSQAEEILGELKDAISRDAFSLIKKAFEAFPEDDIVSEIIKAIEKGKQALAALDGLEVKEGHSIPHPPEDYPLVDLKLAKNPILKGDELEVKVDFLRPGDQGNPDAIPLNSVTYTLEAVKTGWVWSADVIFTQQLENSKTFTANAGVFREWHWYNRNRPNSWTNKLDVGLGLHSAQLNQDPDEGFEIGIGANVSLWGGLLRTGIGYNIIADTDREYWFFGFGLINLLNRVRNGGLSGRAD